MVWLLAFASLGLACVAVGFVIGVNHGIDSVEEDTMLSDPIDVYIPVRAEPKVYDHVEQGDFGEVPLVEAVHHLGGILDRAYPGWEKAYENEELT